MPLSLYKMINHDHDHHDQPAPPPIPSKRALLQTSKPKSKTPKFSLLFRKCMREYSWNPLKTAILVEEFMEKFMEIKAKLRDFDGILCRPSPLISLVWRVAAVHYEKAYERSCWKAFKFVNFDLNWKEDGSHEGAQEGAQDGAQEGAQDGAQENDAYKVTLDTYALLFPLSPHYSSDSPELSWVWPSLSSFSLRVLDHATQQLHILMRLESKRFENVGVLSQYISSLFCRGRGSNQEGRLYLDGKLLDKKRSVSSLLHLLVPDEPIIIFVSADFVFKDGSSLSIEGLPSSTPTLTFSCQSHQTSILALKTAILALDLPEFSDFRVQDLVIRNAFGNNREEELEDLVLLVNRMIIPTKRSLSLLILRHQIFVTMENSTVPISFTLPGEQECRIGDIKQHLISNQLVPHSSSFRLFHNGSHCSNNSLVLIPVVNRASLSLPPFFSTFHFQVCREMPLFISFIHSPIPLITTHSRADRICDFAFSLGMPFDIIALQIGPQVICRYSSLTFQDLFLHHDQDTIHGLYPLLHLTDTPIPVYVKSATGKVFSFLISPTSRILCLKEFLRDLEGIPITQQTLFLGHVVLEEEWRVLDYGIRAGCCITLSLHYTSFLKRHLR